MPERGLRRFSWSDDQLVLFSSKHFSISFFLTPPVAVGTLEVSTQVSKISTPVCGMVALRGDLPVLVGDGLRTSLRVPCGESRELALPDLKKKLRAFYDLKPS